MLIALASKLAEVLLDSPHHTGRKRPSPIAWLIVATLVLGWLGMELNSIKRDVSTTAAKVERIEDALIRRGAVAEATPAPLPAPPVVWR